MTANVPAIILGIKKLPAAMGRRVFILEAWDRNANFGEGRLVEAETTYSMELPPASEFAFFRLF